MKPEIESLLESLSFYEKGLNRVFAELSALRKTCAHVMVPDDLNDISSSGLVCSECGQRGAGWYCPQNPPSHACDYSEGEFCAHCGEPDERL